MDLSKPSRELDKLVAEKVFGQTVVERNSIGRPDYWSKNADGSTTLVPQYSKHIASAWLVVDKLKSRGLLVGIDEGSIDLSACVVSKRTGNTFAVLANVTAEAAPFAICLAALKAVGE